METTKLSNGAGTIVEAVPLLSKGVVHQLTAAIPSLTEDQARWVAVWMKAEDVAMHFNELILNYRLKAIGAMTLAAGLIGSVLVSKEGASIDKTHYYAFAGGMMFLSFLWVAISSIDVFYYQRLLRGAAKEAKRLEDMTGKAIQLSRLIEMEVEGCELDTNDFTTKFKQSHRLVRKIFYGVPLFALVCAGSIAVFLGRVLP